MSNNDKRNARKAGQIAGRCMEPRDSNPHSSLFLYEVWDQAWHEGIKEVREEEQERNRIDPWEEAKTSIYTCNVFDEGQVQCLQEMIDNLREAVEAVH